MNYLLKYLSLWIVCLLIGEIVHAQSDPYSAEAKQWVEIISQERLKKHVDILASDDYQGRETGTEGADMAAAYIADQFKATGVMPIPNSDTYFQPVRFVWHRFQKADLFVGDIGYQHLRHFYFMPQHNASQKLSINKVFYAGYGIDEKNYNNYKKISNKVNNAAVVVHLGEPIRDAGMYTLTQSDSPRNWSEDVTQKILAAKAYGVKAIFFVAPDSGQWSIDRWQQRLNKAYMSLGSNHDKDWPLSVVISNEMAQEIFASKRAKFEKAHRRINKKDKIKTLSVESQISINLEIDRDEIISSNVIGYIPGDDLKDEVVMVTGHYDHLGQRGTEIFNGADDNATGTAVILSIAEAFSKARSQGDGPRRSVVCMLVTGEEKGLLGSRYYTEQPIFDLDQTVVDINIDMVGRIDQRHQSNGNYIYVIGADRISSELHAINEQMNQAHTKLDLDYTYNDENDPNRYYYRSDHYNFAKKGIPSVFYFSGVHKDYHRSTDTADKIRYDIMKPRADLIFYTIWNIANRDERLIRDQWQP